MATLGALWSQQLGFTLTTTGGTVYTHSLGYTPTVILLTPFAAPSGVSPISPGYTAVNTQTITIWSSGSVPATTLVDVTVGSFHSLVR